MYSPKIPERLIPPLYRLARARGRFMTRVVAEALEAYLVGEGFPPAGPPPRGTRRRRRGPARPDTEHRSEHHAM